MQKSKLSVLVCDDDANVASLMTEFFMKENFNVDCVNNGKEGLELALKSSYDLCITDVMMPEMTGLEMIKEMRESGKNIPIIIVSERASREDIVLGYKAGCDDYIIKPFSMEILYYKIQAMLRRASLIVEKQDVCFQLGSSVFDSRQQTINGQRLSSRENELLLILCRKQGQLVERSHILKTLWSADNYFTSRSLSVYINHLRNIINDPRVHIIAVHGRGYKIVVDE